MLIAAISMTSCLKDTDDTVVTYYSDTAITSFTLTTVNTYTTKTSDGTTKTVKSTLATKPVFVIDQYNHKIYNPVPLPSTCDLKHVLATIATKNSGQVVIKSIVGDTLRMYSSTDSTDFSTPREIRAYAQDGSSFRAYTVTFNVKQASSESITWTSLGQAPDGAPNGLLSEIAIEKNDNGFMLSLDNRATWTAQLLGDGEDPSLLPKEDIGYVKMPFTSSKNTDYELIAGMVNENDVYYSVWRRITDSSADASAAKWVYIPKAPDNHYLLPDLNGLSLVRFNSQTYAIGGNGKVYKTRDWGLTWKETDEILLPVSSIKKAATDESGNLWIMSQDDGNVWKGEITVE